MPQPEPSEVWYLKTIRFGAPGEQKKPYKIITQNHNGPCSFIAICNILILRGNIQILPHTREAISYEVLSQLVAEYLLTNAPDVDISAALSIMPHTQKGMDLNPLFTAATAFSPSGEGTGELDLFEKAGIQLVHGWLVDPDDRESEVFQRVQDYDHAVQLIAEVDHLTGGNLVLDEVGIGEPSGSSSKSPSRNTSYTYEEKRKIEDAIVIRKFLENTSSQLTYHGLFHLAQILTPYTPCALFRNSHLSVIYKTSDNGGALFTLVTDQIFVNEPSIVWERMEDVDGSSSSWANADFRRTIPAGGDFVAQTPHGVLAAAGIAVGVIDPIDHQLARQLQEEEDHYLRRERELQYHRTQERKRLRMLKKAQQKSCIIM